MEAQPAGYEIVIATRLPQMQIDDDSVPMAGGYLWRMPFENFNAPDTSGADADHAAAYAASAPVFLRVTLRRQGALVVLLDPAQQRSSFPQFPPRTTAKSATQTAEAPVQPRASCLAQAEKSAMQGYGRSQSTRQLTPSPLTCSRPWAQS